MGLYDTSLGALLIATWINSMLWVLEIVQLYRVRKAYPDDPIMIRVMMLACFIFDTACTIAACATVYLYCVTNWGNQDALALQYWTFPLYVITTTGCAATVQSFLAFRFWSLSRNKLLTLLLSLLVLTAAAGGVYTMFTIILFPTYKDRNKNLVSASIWLSAAATTDISLAAAIVWRLRRIQSNFRTTQTLLSKLSTQALQSGMVTSAIAIIVLITFLQNNQSNICVAVNFFLGRLYTHTMLYSLSIRRKVRRQGGSSGGMHTSGDVGEAPIDLSGIQVSRSVHVDNENASRMKTTTPSQDSPYNFEDDDKIPVGDVPFAGPHRGNFVVMDA